MTAFIEYLWIKSTSTVTDFSKLLTNAIKYDPPKKQAENLQQLCSSDMLHIDVQQLAKPNVNLSNNMLYSD